MTRLTPRLRWRKAVGSEAFPRSERVLKGTLLCLVDLMTSTGELHEWRETIADTTGLPVRTLNRHLQRAVDLGWLVREVPGGNGRRSLYRAVIPGEGCAPEVAHNSRKVVGHSLVPNSPEVVGHLVAHSIKKSASESERVALDDHRGRRTGHDEGREEPEHVVTSQERSYGDEWMPAHLKRPSSAPTAGEVA